MDGSRLHGDDRTTGIFHKLVDDSLRVIIVTVLQSGKRAYGDDVTITSHHGDRFEQMLTLVAIHDDAALRLQFPGTGIDIEHDDVHAEVHRRLLRRETRAKRVVEASKLPMSCTLKNVRISLFSNY